LSLLLDQVLLSFIIELLHRFQIIVWSAESFYIDTHALEHLILVGISLKFEDFSLVILEELGGWVCAITLTVVLLEQVNAVLLVVSHQLAVQSLDLPFECSLDRFHLKYL